MKPIYTSAIVFILSAITGCKKFVEIDPPLTQLITANVFNNNASATAAVTSIYSQMFYDMESYSISQSTGLLGDELTNHTTFSPQTQYYTNAMTAVSPGGDAGSWMNAYKYIYQANGAVEALTNNKILHEAVASHLLGEVKFIRAFWYFYLTNAYGDVPLVTGTNYAVNKTLARTPKEQVTQQIIADLKDAQELLSTNFVDATDTTVTTERIRPTKWAATALLARVYLYHGDWADATTQATAVISNAGQFGLEPDLNNVFLKNSNETIWQIATPLPTNNYNTFDGYFYILLGAPTNSSNYGSSTLSPQMLNSFETTDQRRSKWIDSITEGSDKYYFPVKYKVSTSGDVTEYTMVLRLGEQYLIRAEALAQSDELSNAATDLNVIRARAGLSNTTATTKSELLTAIMHERQVELFTEWGARWFDLIRTGNVNAVMSIVAPFKGGTWDADGHQSLFPVPQSERNADPSLTQNPGY